jgi:hypothetical protein
MCGQEIVDVGKVLSSYKAALAVGVWLKSGLAGR